MSNKVPLSTMLGSGDSFFVGEKKYRVKPLKLKEVDEFTQDGLSVGPALFNVSSKKNKSILDKWIKSKIFDGDGNPMNLEKAMADDWDLVDLKRAVQKLVDISG